MKTYAPKSAEIQHDWYIVDATGLNLGRLASDIARVLRGKHKPTYAPNADVGDYVIVINAGKFAVTGNKMEDKIYYRHSGYPGGLREQSMKQVLERHPTRVLESAVRGMIPHNALGEAMMHKLKLYPGTAHPHEAQQPKNLAAAFGEGPVAVTYTRSEE